jgi:hypothetical protein
LTDLKKLFIYSSYPFGYQNEQISGEFSMQKTDLDLLFSATTLKLWNLFQIFFAELVRRSDLVQEKVTFITSEESDELVLSTDPPGLV